VTEQTESGTTEAPTRTITRTEITFVPSNVWRVGLVLLAVMALGLFLQFVIGDGGSVIFTVLMSWFAALAMAPVVDRLARHMRRGAATGLVMLVFALLVVAFVLAFGSLLVGQLASLIERIPDLITGTLTWVNTTFNQHFTVRSALEAAGVANIDFGSIAKSVGLNLLGVLGSVLGSVFGLFTFGLFTFYFSAQQPQLQSWIASLFPGRAQGVFVTVWRLSAQKTGGYVGARVVLAGVNSVLTGIVFFAVGMPYWLPLALWTGVVAQFVPTIGTYIAIVLPVLVGLLSANPWLGVIALAWGLVYQQVENLTIEPRISAKAVDVNPAVAFAAVMLGAALFGVAGAFLAVPVVAMALAVVETYVHRYELVGGIGGGVGSDAAGSADANDADDANDEIDAAEAAGDRGDG
jgi:predicted PurR-regulated permease PerM